MGIIKPFNKKISKEEMKRVEDAAAAELSGIVEELQKKYDVVVIPRTILQVSSSGITPLGSKLDIAHNQRFKK